LGRRLPQSTAASAAGGWDQQQQQQQLFADEPVTAIAAALQIALDALAPLQATAGLQETANASQQHATAAAAGSSSSSDACRKMLLLAEYLVQWMVSRDDDLAAVRRVLRHVVQAGQQRPGFRAVAEQAVAVVQMRIQERFGFALGL
jgi:hypothetical protein